MSTSRSPHESDRRGRALRIPAAIQSWGVFLAVDPDTFTITHVSDNTDRLIGADPEAYLGQPLSDVFDLAALDAVRDVLSGALANPTEVVIGGRLFDAISHRSGESLFVELEPRIDSDDRALLMMRDTMRSMAAARTTSELWARAASGMRAITGYDRVDISYYHPDGHGEVVAASQADDLESHLGIHFSSANIPDDPSRSYLIKQSRIVVNSRESVALLALNDRPTAADLDLGAAVLAAPSPRDVKLLGSVGYGSTFFVALVRNRELLGVINCGHRSELRLHYTLRDALELLANQLALQIGAMEEIQRMQQRDAVREIRAALVAQVADGGDIIDSLLSRHLTLLDFIPADGVAIYLNGRLGTIGLVPSQQFLTRLPAAIEEAGGGSNFSSDAVPVGFPALGADMPGVAGILIRRLGTRGDYIAWFRGESTLVPEWIEDPPVDEQALPGAEPVRETPPDISGTSAHWADVEGEASELIRELSSVLLAKAAAELAEMATVDPLTGLLNRRALIDALDRLLASRATAAHLALLFIDLDEFKSINDERGHAAGDAALIHVARSLESAARETDVVARLGGDEFVIVLNKVDDSEATQIASRVLDAVGSAPAEGGGRVTASIGVAGAVAGQGSSQLLSAADAAMFRAKLGGRNRVSS